jgi:chromosome segregation ATPase
MNINKTDKKETQEAKQNNEKFPDFKGSSNLVLTSKKKSKEEEIKVKEKAESESEYFFKIEELKKPIEEKESELNSANQQFMSLSLDQGTYKQINENLTKNKNEIKDNSNNIIERKTKEIDDYKSILNSIERKLDETIKESKESRKKTDAKLSEFSNLIAQNSLEISKLSQKIIGLEKSNSLLKKENQEQKKKIQQLENEIKSLKIKFEQSIKEKNEILKIFTQKWRELQIYIMDLEDGNAFLLDRYNELANSVYQFTIDYQIRNANSINEVDQDLYYYNYFN